MFVAEKKMVSITGKASLGWFLGRGYVQERMTVKVEKWCVVIDGEVKPICICQGRRQAEKVAKIMNGSLQDW
ncbi:MAG: hypothetical protein ACRCXB_20085 [Aeromonadaceae bacterium]